MYWWEIPHRVSYYSTSCIITDGKTQFNLVNLTTLASEDEIVLINAYQNSKKIHVVGDGYSWSHIAQTQDRIISHRGIVATDKQKVTATVKAGTPLEQISEEFELDKLGLAMVNLRSVVRQSITGAISSG